MNPEQITPDPDLSRAVRSWLVDGADRLPERVLDAVLEAVPTTRQRRPMWPAWRFTAMSPVFRTGIVVALVVLGLVAGVAALSAGSPTPIPQATPPPTAVPSAVAVPSAAAIASTPPEIPTVVTVDLIGKPLVPGTWTVDVPMAKSFLITVPGGYSLATLTNGKIEIVGPHGSLGVYLVDAVFRDPCAATPATPVADADAVVRALRAMAGFHHGLVTNLLVDGRRAQAFTLSNDIDTSTADCARNLMLPLFHVARTSDEPATNGGTEQFVWVIDGKPYGGAGTHPRAGEPIVVVADGWVTDADLAALRDIVTSMNLD